MSDHSAHPAMADAPVAATLDSLDAEALDAAPWGLIELDGEAVVQRYNRTESLLTGLSPASVIGRRFFEEVAPCTDVPEFRGRFFRGVQQGELDAELEFDFNFVLDPVRVRVRMLSSTRPDRYWIATRVVRPIRQEVSDAQRRAWERNVRRDIDLQAVEEAECASEPIQLPGAIQPFGALLVIDAGDGSLAGFSDNAPALLGAELILSEPASAQLPEALRAPAQGLLEAAVTDPTERVHRVVAGREALPLDAYLHRWRGNVLLELVAREEGEDASAALTELASIERSLEAAQTLEGAWHAACQGLARLSGYDRVVGYQMDNEGNGTVVAEALGGAMESLLGLSFPAADIPPQARALYARQPGRCIPNVRYEPVPLRLAPRAASPDLGFTELRSTSPYHVQYQRNMGVEASFSLSVMVDAKLGGLLIGHHERPRRLGHHTRATLELVARRLGGVLTRRMVRARELRQGRVREAYTDVVRRLALWPLEDASFAELLEALCRMLEADGVALVTEDAEWCTDPAHAAWAREAAAKLGPLARREPLVDESARRRWPEAPTEPAGVLVVAPPNELGLTVVAFRREAEPTIWARRHTSLPGAIERWRQSREGVSPPWGGLARASAADLHRDLEQTLGPLFATRRLLQSSVDEDPVALLTTDAEGRVLSENPAAKRIFGPTTLEGTPLQDRLEGWEPAPSLAPERVAAHEDGLRVPVRAHTARAPGIGQVAFLVYLQDLRPLRALERELAEAQRLEETATLATGLAHDFNNTLGVVLSNAEILADRLASPEDRALLEDVVRATAEGRRIASEMLGFARASGEAERTGVEVAAGVEGCARILRVLAGPRVRLDIAIAPQLRERPGYLGVGTGSLHRVLFNLVSNARDAMEGKGRVVLEAAREGDTIALAVRDSGPGVPLAERGRVFHPYYTTKPRGVGTGLGLFVVGNLVRDAGGSVRVEEAPGGGARFVVVLPEVAPPPAASVAPPAPEPVAPPVRRVLLVEDRADLRRAFGRILRREGFDVIAAANAEEGLSRFEAEAPQIVITDYSMPGMNGLELVEALRRRAPGIPAVLISGLAAHDELDAGPDDVPVLQKPVEAARLVAALSEAVARAARRG